MIGVATSRYLIALGSNVPHPRHGRPERVLAAALIALEQAGLAVDRAAPVMRSRPVGPSRRAYANGAALVATPLPPPDLLHLLKQVERSFGRKRGGQRWGARVLDLDIVLWSGGKWVSPGLSIPHRLFRDRAFVLTPTARIAPGWRDPDTAHTLRQLNARLTRRHSLPKRHPR